MLKGAPVDTLSLSDKLLKKMLLNLVPESSTSFHSKQFNDKVLTQDAPYCINFRYVALKKERKKRQKQNGNKTF